MVRLSEVNLQRAGHEVLTAIDRETAIDLARVEQPDLVVVDARWSDFEETLAADPTTSGIRVLVLSGKIPDDPAWWSP